MPSEGALLLAAVEPIPRPHRLLYTAVPAPTKRPDMEDTLSLAAWLHGLGLGRYEQAFRDNDIDLGLLPTLTDSDLRELGVASLGHRKRLLAAIAALSAPAELYPQPIQASASTALLAERRQLTVMFIDLVGSTELAGQLDPEDMRDLITRYHECCAETVTRLEGYTAKYLGDGVLAYFGWPSAHEHEAECAVRAGLAVVEAVARLTAPDGKPLAARVGIATGPVVVGDLVGSGDARERAVVGEAPNLAARLQASAEPGSVVIAEGTRHLVGDLFTLVDLGTVQVKGFAQPVRAWRVAGESRIESRFDAMHAAELTPLVGRARETALLLDRWQRIKEGEGQVVLLSGEPGIGKSRLVRALREQLVGEPHTVLSLFCSPHHANTALHPVTGLLERAAGLRREDSPERQLGKLEAVLAQAASELREAVPILADLLAIPLEGRYPPLELSPQQKKERTFQALLDQLAGLAVRQPILAIYEDMHWADPTTRELLGRVIEQVQHLPVLAVVTFRLEFIPPWLGQGHVTALSLSRLGQRQSSEMVERVTGGKPLPADVLEQIVAKTDGVPLFVEELTKTVLESGLIVDRGDRYELVGPMPALAVPATLQDSLMARLDRLATVKEVAQIGAVIGREFGHDLLAAAAGLPDNELNDALEQLIGAELIFRRGASHELRYAFKHALVRDVAYQSLLREQRRQLHARIATVLEERFPETAATEPEPLARHYGGAGLARQAVQHWLRAAELAIGRSANLEAIAHCDQAEAQLRTLPPSSERARAELEVQLAKGVAVRAGKGYSAPEAESVFSRACELCEELGDRVRLMHALRGLWAFYYVAARWREAAQVTERLNAAAQGLEDGIVLTIREYVNGVTLFFRGEPAAAERRLMEALRLYDEGDRDAHIRHSGHHAATLIRGHLVLPQCLLGFPEQARRTSDEGLAIARRVAHPFSLAQMLSFSALVRGLLRDWDEAAALASEARDLGTRYGLATHQALGTIAAGIASAAREDPARGAALIQEGMADLRRTGGGFFSPLALAHLALALSASGDKGAALATAAEAVRAARAHGELCWEPEALRIMGEVKLAAGGSEAAEAEAHFSSAVAAASRQAAKSLELRAATSLARLWVGHGERGKAHDLLAGVYGWFSENSRTPDLHDAKALLDTLR